MDNRCTIEFVMYEANADTYDSEEERLHYQWANVTFSQQMPHADAELEKIHEAIQEYMRDMPQYHTYKLLNVVRYGWAPGYDVRTNRVIELKA